MDARATVEIEAQYHCWMRVGTVSTFLDVPTKFIRNCTDRALVSQVEPNPGQNFRLYSFAHCLEVWALDHLASSGGSLETGGRLGGYMCKRAQELLKRGWGTIVSPSRWDECRLNSKPALLAYQVLNDLQILGRIVEKEEAAGQVAGEFRLGKARDGRLNAEVRLLAIDNIILTLMDDYSTQAYGNPDAWRVNGWGPHNQQPGGEA